MLVYRIVNERYQDDLSGRGAKLYGGRWNKIDEAVLYTSSSVSLACLELLANVDLGFTSPRYALLTIEVPDDISKRIVRIEDLAPNWRSTDQYATSKAIGSAWLAGHSAFCLVVPSAVIPQEPNYIFDVLNTRMKDIKIIQVEPFSFDKRLLR